MASLGDFLGGQATTPAGPQPGAQDPGFEERKQGWLQALKEMAQDPVNAMTMVQLGMGLSNFQPGQGTAAQISNAIGGAMAYRGRYEQMMNERQMAEEKAAREGRRVDMEERRAGISERELEMRGEEAKATREYNQERLNLERERLGVERARAGKENTSAQERVIAQLKAEIPGLSTQEALERYTRATTPDKRWQEAVELAQKEYLDAVKQNFMDPAYPIPDTNELTKKYFGLLSGGAQAGGESGLAPGSMGGSRDTAIKIESEADAAKFPPGTWVELNGRRGQVE